MPIDYQCFRNGDAAEEAGDLKTARALFERGAASGDPNCWSRLGLMFDNGIGGRVDKVKAMQCYRRAWRARDFVAAHNIAVLHREKGNQHAMFQWLRRAADAGDDGALIELARYLMDGRGARKNPVAASTFVRRALKGRLSDAERKEAKLMLPRLHR
jgi:TPR repeat protein